MALPCICCGRDLSAAPEGREYPQTIACPCGITYSSDLLLEAEIDTDRWLAYFACTCPDAPRFHDGDGVITEHDCPYLPRPTAGALA